MRRFLFVVTAFLLMVGQAGAATVNHILNWTVTNTPASPATNYRVEEQVSGTWTAVATVPATQMTYTITGGAVGSMATLRVMPVRDGIDGTPSNACTTGILAPDTVLNVTCSSTVVP